MKKICLLLLCSLSSVFAQADNKPVQKGKISFSWGWNRSAYSLSDIKFRGPGYRFRLNEVQAKDRQSRLAFNPYLNPGALTIPQFNARIDYALTDNIYLSLGHDHMKYVMVPNQPSLMNGTIEDSNTKWDNIYNRTPVEISPDLLTFEHTDGLNYINFHAGYSLPKRISSKWHLAWNTAAGTGVLIPKTNVQLLGKLRHDDYHLSGFGFDLQSGIRLCWNDVLFTQLDIKQGYITLPDIRTTHDKADKASQSFGFTECSLIFGFQLNTRKSTN